MAEYDEDEPIEKRFEDLCNALCIEGNVREDAWEKYKDVWANFSIVGDQLQWLVCSLYEACRRSTADSVSGHLVDNAYVSLTRLLSAAKMSLVQFFHRMRKWSEMNDMSGEMRFRIEHLEREFAVSSVIFGNFARSFYALFRYETPQEIEQTTDRITSLDLFRFAWLLFVKARANFPAVADDIVNSYYLLCCCLDWTLGALISANAVELVNQEFVGLPKEFLMAIASGKLWRNPNDQPVCFLRAICEDNDVHYIECKTVKEHFFRPFIARIIERDLGKLRPPGFVGLFQVDNFGATFRMLNDHYEEFVIATGDFDERIYLSATATEQIGAIGGAAGATEEEGGPGDGELFCTPANYHLQLERRATVDSEDSKRTAAAIAHALTRANGGICALTKAASRHAVLVELRAILMHRNEFPSEALANLLDAHCQQSPLNEMQDRVAQLSDEFQAAFALPDPNVTTAVAQSAEATEEAGRIRLRLTHTLYYAALESILMDEVARMEKRCSEPATTTPSGQLIQRLGRPDLTRLLAEEAFHRALFACCAEVVLVCQDGQRLFPWITKAVAVDALHFYKVVELFVRNMELPRDVVRYLNQVVEHVLDAYAWRDTSPMWAVIETAASTGSPCAPSIEEVIPAERFEYYNAEQKRMKQLRSSANATAAAPSPSVPRTSLGVSPLKRSRVDASQSPKKAAATRLADESAQAAAQLLATDPTDQPAAVSVPGAASGAVEGMKIEETSEATGTGKGEAGAVRHDSMAIFFRQFYTLACGRLRDLCQRLGLPRDVLCKCWTLFERCVQWYTVLLRDRCLDQLLLCCVYAMGKLLLHRPLSFAQLVQAYRQQAQAHRDVYRKVLIDKTNEVHPDDDQLVYQTEQRADLSRFYNTLFLPQTCAYIKEFVAATAGNQASAAGAAGPSDGDTRALPSCFGLTPLITVAAGPDASAAAGKTTAKKAREEPRRISTSRNLFVSPCKGPVPMPIKRVTFTVGKGTVKELNELNGMLNSWERRSGSTNLAMGLKRPSAVVSSAAPSTYHVSTGGGPPRAITLLNPSRSSVRPDREDW